MSQRLFTTPRDDVLTGWGRPLQSLFLVSTDRHTGEIGSSHLDDPHGPGLSRHACASGTTWSMSRSEEGGDGVATIGVLPGDGVSSPILLHHGWRSPGQHLPMPLAG
jgi:hypothetical protein